jgi:excisionase family DNA binding protein
VTELLTLTIAQTAALLGWRRQLIDQAIRAGHIRRLNYPGVTRISRKELERYIERITEEQER